MRKRFDEDAKLNESVQALNGWYSSQTRNVFRPPLSSLDAVGEAAPRQAEVLHGLLGDVRRYDTWKAEADEETDEEALGALLRKAELKYDGSRPDLASINDGPVGLPPPGG